MKKKNQHVHNHTAAVRQKAQEARKASEALETKNTAQAQAEKKTAEIQAQPEPVKIPEKELSKECPAKTQETLKAKDQSQKGKNKQTPEKAAEEPQKPDDKKPEAEQKDKKPAEEKKPEKKSSSEAQESPAKNEKKEPEAQEPKKETPAEAKQEPPVKVSKKRTSGKVIVGRLMILLGVLLVIGAGLLFAMNEQESSQAGEASAQALPEVQQAIKEEIEYQEESVPRETLHVNPYDQEAVKASQEMTVKVVNGWRYIGYLTIPAIDLELPVLSEWSFENLGMAPCRHMGSTKSDDLVIAAHNYPTHFGHLHELQLGDEVSFVDMDGVLSTYEVVTVNVIEPTDLAAVQEDSLDLVLYTCTYGGQNRVMVGCQRPVEE